MPAPPRPAGEASPRPRPSRSIPSAWRAVALLLAAAACVGATQGRLAATRARVKETSDVYALPPPEQVVTLSLGYRAALADVLWAHVLVAQGLHTMERRRFENLTLLIDAINALDPTLREPYLYADALITIQHGAPSRKEVLKAREILERGAANRPLDGEIWLSLGHFVAFIAPGSYLTDPAERAAWRLEGAKMLARAAELGGSDSSISWQALSGASVLRRAGDREAAIRFLQRTLAVTDDPELRQQITRDLEALLGEKQADMYRARQEALQELRARDLPFIGKTLLLVLGPPADPAFCAGGAHAEDPRCALTWEEWYDRRVKMPEDGTTEAQKAPRQ